MKEVTPPTACLTKKTPHQAETTSAAFDGFVLAFFGCSLSEQCGDDSAVPGCERFRGSSSLAYGMSRRNCKGHHQSSVMWVDNLKFPPTPQCPLRLSDSVSLQPIR